MRYLCAVALAVACLSGCGGSMNDVLKAEDTLAVTTSQVAHVVDGADALLEVKTRAKMASDPTGALAFYNGYKPKIEKARAAVHTSQDVIADAEATRSRIPAKDGGTCNAGCTGVASDFTAWLPALSSALAGLKDVYSDLKGLVQQ